MARSRTAPSSPSLPGFDKTGAADAQAAPPDDPARRAAIEDDWDEGAVHRGRLRVRTSQANGTNPARTPVVRGVDCAYALLRG